MVLPWTHRLFSKLKSWGLDVYRGLLGVNLQHYLDEFVFRFNQRRSGTPLSILSSDSAPAPRRLRTPS
jgi:hypothetical protein